MSAKKTSEKFAADAQRFAGLLFHVEHGFPGYGIRALAAFSGGQTRPGSPANDWPPRRREIVKTSRGGSRYREA